jgi:hypothetical protein
MAIKKQVGPGPKKTMKVDSKLGSYLYAEGVRGGGQGGIKTKTPTKAQKQGMFNVSLITGSKNPLTAKMVERRQANFYGTAKKKK